MKKMNKKGFTIVELVIVIAVIAILSAVLIPTFSGVVDNAKKTAAVADAKAAYQNYLYNAANAGEDAAADDFIYVAEANKMYVVIKNGQIFETTVDNKTVNVFGSEAEAATAAGFAEGAYEILEDNGAVATTATTATTVASQEPTQGQ